MGQSKYSQPDGLAMFVARKKDIDQYWERGYWISPKLLSDRQIERLNNAHDRIWAGEIDGDGFYYEGRRVQEDLSPTAIRKVNNGWWINDEVRDLCTSTLIGKVACALMKVPACRLWHDQVIEKPGTGPEVETIAGNVGWHQDYSYWQATDTTNMATAWVALQDTDLTNGGMMTLVYSHRWGLVKGSDTFYHQNLSDLRERFEGKVSTAWLEEPCILRAGQASFHHALCFHASGPNRSNRPRRSVAIHLMPDGTAYRTGVQYHTNVRLLGPRPVAKQKFNNHYFPLLDDTRYEKELKEPLVL
jgi:ectoine hydroxylase-related dioxygenase (phytanoyl-CoA dioxygenase family)